MKDIIFSIILIVIGLILIGIPLYELVFACKSASDITWTLGQKGSMKNGLIYYLGCMALGAALTVWGIFRLTA